MSDRSANHQSEERKLEQDHRRERNHKYKWALGEVDPDSAHLKARPVKPHNTSYSRVMKRQLSFQRNKAPVAGTVVSRKHNFRLDSDTSASDSSEDPDVKDASAAPEPDAGYTYSFDAARGPGKGSQILGLALAKAVEKFETKATEKLVKDEYEVVPKEKEEGNAGYTADEDDFEIV